MSRFTESLVVTPLNDGRTWIILSDFGWFAWANNARKKKAGRHI